MLSKLFSWRWGPGGRLRLGAFLGLVVIVIPSLIFIGLDLIGVLRQVEPPPFSGDFVPSSHEVCSTAVDLVDQINKDTVEINELGWPAWPAGDEIKVIDCGSPHSSAPLGVARWHMCGDLRKDGDEIVPTCTSDGSSAEITGGMTYYRFNAGGNILSADMYVQKNPPMGMVVKHEQLHARGFIVSAEDDAKTRYVTGAHTEKPGHILNESGGYGMKWLDRREGGDWPYGEASP